MKFPRRVAQSVRGIMWITLLTLSVVGLLACKSKPATNMPGVSSVTIELAKQDFVELETPLFPYLSDASSVFFTANNDIIEIVAKSFGIKSPFIRSVVDNLKVSINKDHQISVVIKAKSSSFRKKQRLMKRMNAEQLDEQGRFWRLEDSTQDNARTDTSNGRARYYYFDISYKDSIVLTNFETENIETYWQWKVPEFFFEYRDIYGFEAWIWTPKVDFLSGKDIEKFQIDWFSFFVSKYSRGTNVFGSLALKYKGDKSTRTTLKLLVPFLIESLSGVSGVITLPEVNFWGDVFAIEGITFSERVLWELFL